MPSFSTARSRIVVSLCLAVAMTACSLIVDKTKDQCSTDRDCAPAGRAVCLAGVCVVGTPSGGDGGGDGEVGADGGCVPKPPVSQDDFLNATCTSASCISFDNCARLGLCAEAGLPALVTPPVGGI